MARTGRSFPSHPRFAQPRALLGILTTFYLPAFADEPAVSPAFDAGWEETGSADRRKMSTTSVGSLFTDKTITTLITSGQTLFRQFVSDPLQAQTFNSRVSIYALATETLGGLNGISQVVLKVVSGDGSTVRGTLFALGDWSTGTEWATSATNKSFVNGRIPTPVDAQLGDRLVLEMGLSHDALITTASINFGDSSPTNLPEDETTTTAFNPFLGMGQVVLFQVVSNYSRSLSITRTPAPAVVRVPVVARPLTISRSSSPSVIRAKDTRRALALGGPVVLDHYADPNGTSLDQHRPDAGPLWVEAQGDWEIQSNQAALVTGSGAGGQNYAVIDAGVADGSVTSTIIAPNADWNAGLIANFTDDNNYWLAQIGNGGLFLWEVNGGGFTLRAFSSGPGVDATYSARLTTNGDVISLYIDGVLMVSYTGAPRVNKTGTKFGIRVHSASDLGVRFDNFMVGPFAQIAPSPVIARLAAARRPLSVIRASSPSVSKQGVFARLLSITRSSSPVVTRRIAFSRTISLTRSPSQVLVRLLSFSRFLAVTRASAQTVSRLLSFMRSVSLTRGPAPSLARRSTLARALQVTRATSPSVIRSIGFRRLLVITRSTTQVASRRVVLARALGLTTSPTVSTSRTASYGRSQTTSIPATPIVRRVGVFLRSVQVSRGAAPTVSYDLASVGGQHFDRALAASIAISQAVSRQLTASRMAIITRSSSPGTTRRLALRRMSSTSIQPSPTLSRQFLTARLLVVTRAVSMSLAHLALAVRSSSLALQVSPSVKRAVSLTRSLAVSITPGPSVIGAVIGVVQRLIPPFFARVLYSGLSRARAIITGKSAVVVQDNGQSASPSLTNGNASVMVQSSGQSNVVIQQDGHDLVETTGGESRARVV